MLCLLATGACSSLDPIPVGNAPTTAQSGPPAPPASIDDAPGSAPSSAAATASAATPTRRPSVVVVSSSDAPIYSEVAGTLDRALAGDFELERFVLGDDSPSDFGTGLDRPETIAVVAIGARAAEFARSRFDGPVVVCQVLDLDRYVSEDARMFGVAALPPAEMQLQSWQRLAGDRATIGVIVDTTDRRAAEDAAAAARAVGLDLIVEHASSDREVLYRFKRLARRIDGLWLLPDSEILSPAALREVFAYAREQRVHTIVFSPALLEWGALISVGSSSGEIAAAAADIVAAIGRGDENRLPRITPLRNADVRVNRDVAAAVGLGPDGPVNRPTTAGRARAL
jgi:hypothetical protein